MASVSIRDLDDEVRDRLRVRAARNGRSMEAEMRAILTAAVADGKPQYPDAVRMLVALFRENGGADLDIPARRVEDNRPPVDFSRWEDGESAQ